MAKAVGLSRKITLKWLNKAVELLGEGLTEWEYKEKMNEYLSYEIKSPTVLRKTREILMHVWFYEEDEPITAMRQDAFDLIRRYPDCGLAIHWCMLLTVYPVFAELCRLMGRMSELNEVITLRQLRQKLYDEWGERSTLYHSTDKLIETLKELGVISADRPGSYTPVKHPVSRPEVVSFLIRTAMKADGNSYYSFTDLSMFEILFPFEYTISSKALMEDRSFIVTCLGGTLCVTLKNG